jgi:hypothetical protein
MRTLVLALALLAAAAPLAAQAEGHDHDATSVQGTALPTGWALRLDRPDANRANLRFVRQGAGYHFTAGPAAVLYRAHDTVRGQYTARAAFTQLRAPTHPEAYGLTFGGANLQGPTQTYFYFLVRGDGKYTVKHRAGTEVHTLTDWTASDAVVKADSAGRARNVLEVRVRADGTHLLVNGTEVHTLPANVSVAGIAGLRLNHNLDVQVDDFRVIQGARR